MSDTTKIEWTDATWNPMYGCTKVSAGCKHCYAERTLPRLRLPFGEITLREDKLDQPLRWTKPRHVFVNSLSDLFHEDVPDEFILRVFETIRAAHARGHVFQVLTKRAERMADFCRRLRFDAGSAFGPGPHRSGGLWLVDGPEVGEVKREVGDRMIPGYGFSMVLRQLWLGVSVEDQAAADERIPHLLETPAAVRFLSCEPLLGPVDLSRWLWADLGDKGRARLNRLHWVIVGGESGPKARPMHPAWARTLRDQCETAEVPFFFKQWGEWAAPFYVCADDPNARRLPQIIPPNCQWLNLAGGQGFHGEDVVAVERVGKKRAGRELDGRTHDAMPEVTR